MMNTSWMLQGVSDPEASNDDAPGNNELGILEEDDDHLDFHIPVHHSTAALLEQAALMNPASAHHQAAASAMQQYSHSMVQKSMMPTTSIGNVHQMTPDRHAHHLHMASSASSTPSSGSSHHMQQQSKLESPETPFYCSRCRYTKDVTSFMDGNRKRKTCSSCRSYGRKYLKKKEGQVDLPGEEHLPEETKHTARNVDTEDEETLRLNNMTFIDNMNWLCHHLNEFKDNLQHVKSLRKEFGRIIAHSRLSIESYMSSSASLSLDDGRLM